MGKSDYKNDMKKMINCFEKFISLDNQNCEDYYKVGRTDFEGYVIYVYGEDLQVIAFEFDNDGNLKGWY